MKEFIYIECAFTSENRLFLGENLELKSEYLATFFTLIFYKMTLTSESIQVRVPVAVFQSNEKRPFV